ncbi:MAG: hypothetical protein ABW252_11710 [Polyangiales bacterium]
MMNSMVRRALIACALGVLGCADGVDVDDGARVTAAYQTTASSSLLPLKQGNTWTYKVTEDGAESTKVVTIGALETVGGTGPSKALKANKSVTQKAGGGQTISWQAEVDGRVVRYREQSIKKSGAVGEEVHWAPPSLRVDGTEARVKAGVTWTEKYTETVAEDGESFTREDTETWTVEGVDVEVTVPAGTFRAVVLKKESPNGTPKTFWYARGVGKVKETGGQTEELSAYKLAP